jgi:hypothetical protein
LHNPYKIKTNLSTILNNVQVIKYQENKSAALMDSFQIIHIFAVKIYHKLFFVKELIIHHLKIYIQVQTYQLKLKQLMLIILK